MPQYTSTYTATDGTVTTSVLDTVTNEQTITVTAPTGQVASQIVSFGYTNTNLDNIVTGLARQLEQEGAGGGGGVGLRGIVSGISATSTSVTDQRLTGTEDNFFVARGWAPVSIDEVTNRISLSLQETSSPPVPLEDPPVPDGVADVGELGINTDLPTDAALGELGINTALTEPPVPDGVADVGELGINTDLPTDAALGELGINTDLNRANTAKIASEEPTSKANGDWRVKLSLAKSATYLYRAAQPNDPLFPLKETDGVIFPYLPQIGFSYQANYEPADLAHTNYKFYQYKNSEVSQINITAYFTAQDLEEANYLLAVIHFFRSVTKMFYGQDANPVRGTPPPLCFLTGLGPYQFDNHPLLVNTFQYNLPDDVDYIRTGPKATTGVTLDPYKYKQNVNVPGLNRLFSSNLRPGAATSPPKFTSLTRTDATYVPTKMQINLTCIPIVTRSDISNNFSVEKYAQGKLRGIW
jgi:hypothetical protein